MAGPAMSAVWPAASSHLWRPPSLLRGRRLRVQPTPRWLWRWRTRALTDALQQHVAPFIASAAAAAAAASATDADPAATGAAASRTHVETRGGVASDSARARSGEVLERAAASSRLIRTVCVRPERTRHLLGRVLLLVLSSCQGQAAVRRASRGARRRSGRRCGRASARVQASSSCTICMRSCARRGRCSSASWPLQSSRRPASASCATSSR